MGKEELSALVGFGLIWLRSTTTTRISSGGGSRGSGNQRDIGVVERGQQVVGRALHKAQDATTGAAAAVRDAAGAAGDAVSTFAHDAKGTVTGIAQQAGDLAQQAGESVSSLASQTQATARQVERRFETSLHDNRSRSAPSRSRSERRLDLPYRARSARTR